MATLPLSCPQDAVQDVVAEVLADMIDIVASDPPLLLIPPLPGRQRRVRNHQPDVNIEASA